MAGRWLKTLSDSRDLNCAPSHAQKIPLFQMGTQMAGVKGRNGGARLGAGRKPKVVNAEEAHISMSVATSKRPDVHFEAALAVGAAVLGARPDFVLAFAAEGLRVGDERATFRTILQDRFGLGCAPSVMVFQIGMGLAWYTVCFG